MMAYSCILGIKEECDGCGQCQKEAPVCPNCFCRDYECLFEQNKEIIGCSECIKKVWRD